MRLSAIRALAVLALVLPAVGIAPADDTPKVRVVLIDGQNNHNWRLTTPYLKKSLEKSGRFTVDVSSNLKPGDKPGIVTPTVDFPPDLEKYEVVVSSYNGALWPTEFRTAFEERLAAGKIGFVLFHAANNCFADWPAFNRMTVLAWRGSKASPRQPSRRSCASGSVQTLEQPTIPPATGAGSTSCWAVSPLAPASGERGWG